MANAILLVESRASSREDAARFHKWYDEVHIPEMLAVDGFVSARRLASGDGESFIAIYEIDTDIETARANLAAAQGAGRMSRPEAVRLDPPPTVRYFQQLREFGRA